MADNSYKIDEKTFTMGGTLTLLDIHSDGSHQRNASFSLLNGRYSVYVKQEVVTSAGPLVGEVRSDSITKIGYVRLGSDVEHDRWTHRFADYVGSVPNVPDLSAPTPLAAGVSLTFTLERWFRESYNDSFAADRPDSIEDVTGAFFWKYKAGSAIDVSITLNGDDVSFSDDPEADAALLVTGDIDGMGAAAGADNFDPTTAELAGAAYATLAGVEFQLESLTAAFDKWSVTQTIYADSVESDGTFNLPQSQTRTSHDFVTVPSLSSAANAFPDVKVFAEVIDMARTNRFQVGGELHEGPLAVSPFDLHLGGGGGYDVALPGPVRLNDSISPGGSLVLATPYNTQNNRNAPLWEYGSAYDSLSLDHAAESVIDTFEYRWTGTNLASGPSVSGGRVHLTGGASGSCTLSKTLVSDLEDMIALDRPGRAAWWQTQKAAGLIPTWMDDWWNAVGNPALAGTDHVGEIHKIGRRIRDAADSDEFRMNARYIKVTGKADAPCTITLKVEADDLVFRELGFFTPPAGLDQFNPYDLIVLRRAMDATFTIDLDTGDSDTLIDLSAKFGNFPVSSVKAYTITVPNDRVIELEPLALARKSAPLLYAHPMWPDLGYEMSGLFADLDGMASLAVHNTTANNPTFSGTHTAGPFTLGGWPLLRLHGTYDPGTHSGASYHFSTVGEVVAELNLQLGWEAAYLGGPGHSSKDVPFWWDVFRAAEAPQTITAKRKFYGGISLPAGTFTDETFAFKAHLGFDLLPLVVKADTLAPIRAKIELDRDSTVEGVSATGPDGTGHLYGKHGSGGDSGGETYTAYASKGEAEESSDVQPPDVPMMTVWFAYLTGKPTGGQDLDYAADPFAEWRLMQSVAAGVDHHRSTDREATHARITAVSDPTPISGLSRVIYPNGHHLLLGVQGGLVRRWESDSGRAFGSGADLFTDRTYLTLVARQAPFGLTHLHAIDDAGNTLLYTSGDGATWAGPTALSDLPEAGGRGDLRHDANRWLRLHVGASGGGDLYESPDGLAWSLMGSVFGAGSYGSFLALPGGPALAAYHDGSDVRAVRAAPAPAGAFTWGSPALVEAGATPGELAIASYGNKALIAVGQSDESVNWYNSRDQGRSWAAGGYG